MDVSFDSWLHSRMQVTADGQSSPMYEIDISYIRNKLTFSINGQEIAKSNMHFHKTSFDISLQDNNLHVTSDKFWKIQRSYDSPAFGQKLTWKSQSSFTKLDFVCLDEKSMPVARFVTKNGLKKVGRIEFDDAYELDQAKRDEIVVVGVTLAYQIIQSITGSSSAASAASSSAAASVAVS